MKKLGILVLFSVFLMGCGDNPKKAVIPIDFESKKWKSLVKELRA